MRWGAVPCQPAKVCEKCKLSNLGTSAPPREKKESKNLHLEVNSVNFFDVIMKTDKRMKAHLTFCTALCLLFAFCQSEIITSEIEVLENPKVTTKEYSVTHSSTMSNFTGITIQLYLREKYLSNTLNTSNLENKVVLFIHGNSVPGTVSFDLNKAGYSWMNALAEAGLDVFSVDLTGYGASTRPAPMNEVCNLSRSDQAALGLNRCTAKYNFVLKTSPDEVQEINTVVDYIRNLRKVQKVYLIGYSLGGARTLAYASTHPDKVARIVTLGNGTFSNTDWLRPRQIPAVGAPVAIQTRQEFINNWTKSIKSDIQVESGIQNLVFDELLKTDPLGASWGSGGSRSPTISVFGFVKADLKKVTQPILILNGTHDHLGFPAAGRALWSDVASTQKIHLEVQGASHFVLWERQHTAVFKASAEWLQNGTIGGRNNSRGKIDTAGNYIW